MISQLPTIALLLSGLGLLLTHKPRVEWAGRSAAVFCAGLLLALAAGSALLPVDAAANTLLQQLATYAALPVLAAVLLADAAGLSWQRPAWGRVLLGICALYEVLRRADALDYLLAGTTVAGLAALLVMQLRRQTTATGIAALVCWGGAVACVFSGVDTTITAILCSASLITAVRRAE